MKLKTILFVLAVSLSSCSKNPLDVDISGINIDLNIQRIDQSIYPTGNESLSDNIDYLRSNYPDFWNLYIYKVLNILDNETYNAEAVEYGLNLFINDTVTLNLRRICSEQYGDFEKQRKDLDKAFKHYKYYYPNGSIPNIYTYLSGLNQSIISADSLIGIGLDKYLGSDFEYYKRLNGVYAYQVAMMKPSQILPDVMYTWAITELVDNEQESNVLKEMLRLGKIYYFIDAMLPDYPDSVKMGYLAIQMDFCENNERQMWAYLVENQLLYSNKRLEIKRYNDVGPFTSTFGKESPGRVGAWIGLQIIRTYMKNNPEVSLPDLMANKDLQQIFLTSGYAP
ncbi:MAG: hypothetical protein ACK5IQ_08710 [Bacteroidales bacterium]